MRNLLHFSLFAQLSYKNRYIVKLTNKTSEINQKYIKYLMVATMMELVDMIDLKSIEL